MTDKKSLMATKGVWYMMTIMQCVLNAVQIDTYNATKCKDTGTTLVITLNETARTKQV